MMRSFLAATLLGLLAGNVLKHRCFPSNLPVSLSHSITPSTTKRFIDLNLFQYECRLHGLTSSGVILKRVGEKHP